MKASNLEGRLSELDEIINLPNEARAALVRLEMDEKMLKESSANSAVED